MQIKNTKLILYGIVGSTAYGLDTSTSDVDYAGIFVYPTPFQLHLNSYKETYTMQDLSEAFTQESKIPFTEEKLEYDCVYHEVKKFMQLASKGNPSVLELLFLNEYKGLTKEGELLLQFKNEFLSNNIKNAYGGYAYAQAKRYKKKYEKMQKMFGNEILNRVREEYGKILKSTGYLQNMRLGKEKETLLYKSGKIFGAEPVKKQEMERNSQNSISKSISSDEKLWSNGRRCRKNERQSEGFMCDLWRNNAGVCGPQSYYDEDPWSLMSQMQLRLREFHGQPGFIEGSDSVLGIFLGHTKHIRHCFRLLDQGTQLLTTGTLNIKVKNPEYYFDLGNSPPEKVIKIFEEEYQKYCVLESILQDKPDLDKLNDILLQIRLLN